MATGRSGGGTDLRAQRIIAFLVSAVLTLTACHVANQEDYIPHRAAWGVFVQSLRSGTSDTNLPAVTTELGQAPTYVHRFVALSDRVPTADLDAIVAAGSTPLVTIEPWVPGRGIDQPDYSLSRIASGAFDTDFDRWGQDLGKWRKPVLVRFAHEMNGPWYPWSVGVNGNSTEDYLAAWRQMWQRIHPLAPNVKFVWAPNAVSGGPSVVQGGISDFRPMYPGPEMVDYLGLDGYNWGDGRGRRWQSPQDIFAVSLMLMDELAADRQLIITEVAAAEDPNDPRRKADWISEFIHLVSGYRQVEAFVWFQVNKERDWRFNSSDLSLNAFRDGLDN